MGRKRGIFWDFPIFPTPEPPRALRDVREALEQRMERYRAAAAQAKDSGDGRKARMHERIVKVGEPSPRTVIPIPEQRSQSGHSNPNPRTAIPVQAQ